MAHEEVIKVTRDFQSWVQRNPDTPYMCDRSYICANELDHYFCIPDEAKLGWVTLSSVSKRPGEEWLKLKLVRQKEAYEWSSQLKVEPRPGDPRRWRQLSMYRPFRLDIERVGSRPGGLSWCWMKFEYEA